jgi:hypothetical protein
VQLGDTSADFGALNIAHIDATKSGLQICGNAGSGFTLTVDFDPPNNTVEVLDAPLSSASRYPPPTPDGEFNGPHLYCVTKGDRLSKTAAVASIVRVDPPRS